MIEDGIHISDCLVHLKDDIEHTSEDGLFMKGMIMEKAGTVVGQHAHIYGHTSLLVRGKCVVYVGDNAEGVKYEAPAFIWVPEKEKHRFVSLEDNTHIYCIHNTYGAKNVKIYEEHKFIGAA